MLCTPRRVPLRAKETTTRGRVREPWRLGRKRRKREGWPHDHQRGTILLVGEFAVHDISEFNAQHSNSQEMGRSS